MNSPTIRRDEVRERWLAGALLTGQTTDGTIVAADAIDPISPDDLIGDQESEILRAAKAIKARGEAVDCTSILAEAERTGATRRVWNGETDAAKAMAALMDETPSLAGLGQIVTELVTASNRRKAIQEANRLAFELNRPGADPAELQQSVARLAELVRSHDEANRPRFTTLENATAAYLEKLQSGQAALLETGIPELDYAIGGGMEFGELMLLCGRPGHGKSAVALQMAEHVAGLGIPAAYISEEMSATALGKRTVQFASGVHKEHWPTRIEGVRQDVDVHFHDRAPVLIYENCRSASAACQVIREAVREHGVRFVVVDYAQLLSSPGKTRYEQVTATSIALRQVTNETGVALVALCQLNRQFEDRSPMIPRNSDIKDSGQLEQDADVIVFVVWPHRVDSSADPALIQLFVGKNRNREINTPTLECRFEPARQRVSTMPASSQQPDYTKGWK